MAKKNDDNEQPKDKPKKGFGVHTTDKPGAQTPSPPGEEQKQKPVDPKGNVGRQNWH